MEVYSEKQLAIIQVAERLFAERGFHGTSVRDIAHEAEVNIAMISYYFGSKDKLLAAVFLWRMNASRDYVSGLAQDTTLAPLDKIYMLIERFVNKMVAEPNFQCIMTREQLNKEESPIRELIWEMKGEMLSLIESIIHEGQRLKTFREDVDVLLLVTTLFGTINQVVPAQQVLIRKKMYPAGVDSMTEEEFRPYLVTRLNTHLKQIFKAILTHES